MGNPNTKHKETAEQFGKEAEIYKNVFEMTEGTYEKRSEMAQNAVAKYRQTMLGEKFRSEIAKQVAGLAPAPESGELSPELKGLSQEKIVAWLDRYQGNIKNALVAMFHLDPKYKMSDDELALFMGELKDPAHVKQKTFFALSDWLGRVRREARSIKVDEATVIDRILSDIAENQPPAELKAKKAA